jgi:L-threonylcarbamoyladenylate synthase
LVLAVCFNLQLLLHKTMDHQHKEVIRAQDELLVGNVIVYPTDTVWGIGCDATNSAAVKKVFKVKNRPEDKSFIVLVSDLDMLQKYVQTLPSGFENQLQNQERPTTFVFPACVNIAPELIREDGSVAIRVVQHDDFLRHLIQQLDRPIVSTSANISGETTGGSYADIPEAILNNVDYVVNWRQEETITAQPSRIIKLNADGTTEVLRD